MTREKMIRDEPIWVTIDGVRLEGRLVLASANQRSLGVDVRGMPHMSLLRMPSMPEGEYRDVFSDRIVKVEAGPAGRLRDDA
jgi:hypothetical protein